MQGEAEAPDADKRVAFFESSVPSDRVGIVSPWEFSPQVSSVCYAAWVLQAGFAASFAAGTAPCVNYVSAAVLSEQCI